MELVIKGRNTEVSDSDRDYIERKMGKFDHYLSQILETEVEVAEKRTRSQGEHFVVQVTALANGTILRAQESDASFRTAVDTVTHTMIQQITRFKGKLNDRGKAGPTIRTGELPESLAPKEEAPRVIRTKRFAIKPMDLEEAAEQMDLLGHDFFLFLNSETGQYGVVYRRGDGNYGLIEPELP